MADTEATESTMIVVDMPADAGDLQAPTTNGHSAWLQNPWGPYPMAPADIPSPLGAAQQPSAAPEHQAAMEQSDHSQGRLPCAPVDNVVPCALVSSVDLAPLCFCEQQ